MVVGAGENLLLAYLFNIFTHGEKMSASVSINGNDLVIDSFS